MREEFWDTQVRVGELCVCAVQAARHLPNILGMSMSMRQLLCLTVPLMTGWQGAEHLAVVSAQLVQQRAAATAVVGGLWQQPGSICAHNRAGSPYPRQLVSLCVCC